MESKGKIKISVRNMGVLDAPRVTCYTQERRENNGSVLIKNADFWLKREVLGSARPGANRISAYDLDAPGLVYGALQGLAVFVENLFSGSRKGNIDGVLLATRMRRCAGTKDEGAVLEGKLGIGGNNHSEEGAHV